ncbi:MAG: PLP-dependent aminotransferase family protein [Eggerthellaceae bacterium]|nr:PLP-dependent aminotransferase family protein [Eggerthellaceae bacterium]
MPSLDRNSSVPYYQQVYEQISEGIESGVYPAGKRLPSIRECARELGVSNTTIELAYQRLVEEGYVEPKRGSGFTICKIGSSSINKLAGYSEEYRQGREKLEALDQELSQQSKPLFDFAYDSVDASTFPLNAWARICRDVFFSEGAQAACLYNDRQGLKDLRVQISRYLRGEYGIDCTSEQVLVMPTTKDLVTEITMLFDPEETVVAMEEPGYDEVGKRMRERGSDVRLMPVTPYPSLEEAEKLLQGVSLVFATPACQFPTNHVMPIETRRSLVAWASEHGAYVIDDEYGWEFQSGVARVPSLAALDEVGRVITIGTFSNSFTPAVSLSYAVLPPQLMLRWQETRRDAHPQVAWQTQAAMARFMAEGHWRTHIRKLRTSVLNKRERLLKAIHERMGAEVEVVEGTSSLFVLVKTRDGRDESELIEAAANAGVKVYPTSRYWSGAIPAEWRYVLVGYAGIPADKIDEGIKALAEAWGF